MLPAGVWRRVSPSLLGCGGDFPSLPPRKQIREAIPDQQQCRCCQALQGHTWCLVSLHGVCVHASVCASVLFSTGTSGCPSRIMRTCPHLRVGV
jgi:hypothetical protein